MPNSLLLKIRTDFVENLTGFAKLLDQLLAEDVINKDDYQNIESTLGQINKNRKLLDILDEKRWEKIKDKLISALLETDNEFIIEKIKEQGVGKVVAVSAQSKITLNLDYLSENLSNIPSILNQLISKQLITIQERTIITSKVGDDQATELFLLLSKKDMDNNLSTVLEILKATGNGHLAKRIEST